ncbi:ATP-binding cassette glutathione S-conjugate transporter ycf1 [Coemansia sp. S146]|nr:ATP-binding cassette glutathione S-conjugate transporter ycf1 [Coemansia sp. S146]
MTQGTGRLVGKIAYLEQQPWIMNDTLRANTLFGRKYDEDYYWKVLNACALVDDLEVWPNGDLTIIGENGIIISGGQRACLALARTVYSQVDIYFLDGPLSAVDAIVKRHILDNIILSTGILGDKLRFVTTNADSISTLCNQVVTVDNGSVSVKVQTPKVHTAFNCNTVPVSKPKEVGNSSKELQTVSASNKKQTGNILDETTGEGINTSSSNNCNADDNSKYPKQWSHWDNALYAIRICLCRVIMCKRKIVVLDEATVNVDLETDKSIQELISTEFSDCTVLTIAHRLDTIMNSHRIILMDKGTIAEIGTPQELLAKDRMFAQLIKTSDFGQ